MSIEKFRETLGIYSGLVDWNILFLISLFIFSLRFSGRSVGSRGE
jgi:hypothetical protein